MYSYGEIHTRPLMSVSLCLGDERQGWMGDWEVLEGMSKNSRKERRGSHESLQKRNCKYTHMYVYIEIDVCM